MATSTTVITDSSCSLVPGILRKYHIKQVPLKISIDGNTIDDPCDANKTLALFRSGRLSKKHKVATEPPTVEDFEGAISEALLNGNKNILIQTVNRKQGETYDRANVAASSIKRKLGSRQDNVTIRVMDSRTVFAGQGLMITETIRRILHSQDANETRRQMDHISEKIHTFIVPKEPLLAFERAQKRNEKAVGWTQVFVANTLGIHPILCIVNDSSYLAAKPFGFEKSVRQLFHHACQHIEKGLLSPLVSVNYAGPIETLKELPGYAELEQTAQKNSVKLMPAVMSIAGGIYTSVGSVSLAFASETGEWLGNNH